MTEQMKLEALDLRDVLDPSDLLNKDYMRDENNGSFKPMEWMLIQTIFYMIEKQKQKCGKNTFDAETEFMVSFDDFCELFEIEEQDDFLSDISSSVRSLMRIEINYPLLEMDAICISNIFASVSHNFKRFSFYLVKNFIPYLQDYGNAWQFFSDTFKLSKYQGIDLLYGQFMKLKHSRDLSDSEDKSNFEVTLNVLRTLLAPDSNMITADFNRRVLIPALEIINRQTSIHVEIAGVIKKGRATDGYIFSVTKNNSVH